MRFFADGPIIPDELLEKRDSGRVVFFCGAGVSLSADMPDFLKLTQYVVDKLRVPKGTVAREMLASHEDGPSQIPKHSRPSFDRIFNVLQQRYRADEIDFYIADKLIPKPGASLKNHEIILRLSKSIDGKHQIVTTNFDHLFERAAKPGKLKHFVPPALPDLDNDQALDGLVYLHGQVDTNVQRGTGRQSFVISSSDFGRAYLSEGWATRFVRSLVGQYTIVLLGYSAEDPPIQYLLEGLHARTRGSHADIYAFDNGGDDEVKQRWHGRGVVPLPYVPRDEQHSALWDTLGAWAERADDPAKWKGSVVELAQRGPKQLTAVQRGQVMSIVKTRTGAELFFDATPPPPGDWLCVFAASLRHTDDGFKLDDDSPPPSESNQAGTFQDDSFPDLKQEGNQNPSDTQFTEISPHRANPFPNQLQKISKWVGKIAHEPITFWWAWKCQTHHPDLLYQIEQHVDRLDDLPDVARRAWRLLIEKFITAPDSNRLEHPSLNKIRRRINSEGWTPGVLRDIARITQPYLKFNSTFGPTQLPVDDWSKIRLPQFFEVGFPVVYDLPAIPDDVTLDIYRILRGQLELAATLLADTGRSWFQIPTFYPEKGSVRIYHGNSESYFVRFHSILNRLIKMSPDAIRSDSVLWPKEEPCFFDRLRLYVWSKPSLFEGSDVARELLAISDDAFWNSRTRRELLFMLAKRWQDFPTDLRLRIERRIAQKRPWIDDNEDLSKAWSIEAAMMLGWLEKRESSISEETKQRLKKLRTADPRWMHSWDDTAAESRDPKGGWIGINPDPSSIINLPLDRIIPVASVNTRAYNFKDLTSHQPFGGLVERRPLRAVAALSHASRAGEYPVDLWQSALDNWSNVKPSSRLTRLFIERLARLPEDVIFKLRHSLFPLAEKHLPVIARSDLDGALRILDNLLIKFFAESDSTTLDEVVLSGISESSTRNGEQFHQSFELALNSPTGRITECLLTILGDMKRKKDMGIPDPIKSRLNHLLAEAPEHGRKHAISMIARSIKFLHHIDSAWIMETVLPLLHTEHPLAESAWSGFAYTGDLPEPVLFGKLKPNFLEAVTRARRQSWDPRSSELLQEQLAQGCLWHIQNLSYVSFEEFRVAMLGIDDAGRSHCLQLLAPRIRDVEKWPVFGKPFLEQAWPQENECRTDTTSRRFAVIAVEAESLFPDVVDAVLPYLDPIVCLYEMLTRLEEHGQTDKVETATKHPSHALKLLTALVPDNSGWTPYELDKLGTVVGLIGDADPALRKDAKWRRLDRIAHGE